MISISPWMSMCLSETMSRFLATSSAVRLRKVSLPFSVSSVRSNRGLFAFYQGCPIPLSDIEHQEAAAA